MYEVGRIVVKLAGRDSGKMAVIVEKIDDRHVLIDGQTRRRKCNVAHLHPLEKTIDLKENASHADVEKEFQKINLEVRNTKPKTVEQRPKKRITQKANKKKESLKKEKKLTKTEKPESGKN
jgi:large subunit ribosomal protein L14e